ncbi:MAG: protein tyrosine phosphatase family protein [Anaerolineae bacterium]
MDTLELSAITNFRRLAPDLITGGQPTAAQLAAVATAGCEVVINLALHDASYSLPDERGSVEALGMTYEHIPVIWERPTGADLRAFFAVMERHAGRRAFVHCAANYRASAFILLYRVLRLGWRLEDALPDMRAVWNPADYPAWQAFINAALTNQSEPEQLP